jgi:hypothetical protein
MGPRRPHSTVLTEAQQAIVVEVRRHTLLPAHPIRYVQPDRLRLE